MAVFSSNSMLNVYLTNTVTMNLTPPMSVLACKVRSSQNSLDLLDGYLVSVEVILKMGYSPNNC